MSAIGIPKGTIGIERELGESVIGGGNDTEHDVLNCFQIGAEYRVQGGRSHAAEQRPVLARGQAEQAKTVVLVEFVPVRLSDDVVQDLGGLTPTALLTQDRP